MSAQKLIPLLEQIRDQQKQQLANFERSLAAQQAATELHKRGQKLVFVFFGLPWLLVLGLLVILAQGGLR